MLSGLSIFRECARKRKIKCPPCGTPRPQIYKKSLLSLYCRSKLLHSHQWSLFVPIEQPWRFLSIFSSSEMWGIIMKFQGNWMHSLIFTAWKFAHAPQHHHFNHLQYFKLIKEKKTEN